MIRIWNLDHVATRHHLCGVAFWFDHKLHILIGHEKRLASLALNMFFEIKGFTTFSSQK